MKRKRERLTSSSLILFILSILLSSFARADTTATLAPAPPQQAGFFHAAALTLDNQTAQTVRGLLLHPKDGGPSVYWPVVVPSGTKQQTIIPLPAMSISQPYDVHLLADDGPFAKPIATVTATINWPPDMARRDFLQPDYEEPHWPWTVKRDMILLLTLGALAMTATLLIGRRGRGNSQFAIRNPQSSRPVAAAPGSSVRQCSSAHQCSCARLAALIAILAATTLGALWYIHSLDPVVQGRVLLPTPAETNIVTISALHSTTWSAQADLAPIYQTQSELREDQLIIQPYEHLWLPMKSGDTRLFHRDRLDVRPAPAH